MPILNRFDQDQSMGRMRRFQPRGHTEANNETPRQRRWEYWVYLASVIAAGLLSLAFSAE
jgi:hypothetical protein